MKQETSKYYKEKGYSVKCVYSNILFYFENTHIFVYDINKEKEEQENETNNNR